MVCERIEFMMLLGKFSEVAMDVAGITALGFQLDGHVFDLEVRADARLDHLQQVERSMITIDHDMAGEHDQARLHRPDVEIMHILDARDGFHSRGDMGSADCRRGGFEQYIE